MGKPLVSISCITYNQGPFIKECLDGFLRQKTDFSFEILINDDASTDDTAEIIKDYQAKYPNLISPIYQIENQYSQGQRGINIKFNLPRAKGKYIALCEGDDYWTDPLKLQKQVDFLESNPDYSACFTNAIIINENGIKEKLYIKEGLPEEINFDMILTSGGGIYPTPSLMFRNYPLIFPDFIFKVSAGDWAIGLILSSRGNLKYLKEVTCAYRKHSGGVFTSIEKNTKMRRRMNINSVSFLHKLNKYLNYKKGNEIKTRISQISKLIILRTSKKKTIKENIIYFKQLNITDLLSLFKQILVRKK